MPQPEAYVDHVDKLFDEHGKLANDRTRKFLQAFLQAFADWVETIRSQGDRICRSPACAAG
jgi:chromate reductase